MLPAARRRSIQAPFHVARNTRPRPGRSVEHAGEGGIARSARLTLLPADRVGVQGTRALCPRRRRNPASIRRFQDRTSAVRLTDYLCPTPPRCCTHPWREPQVPGCRWAPWRTPAAGTQQIGAGAAHACSVSQCGLTTTRLRSMPLVQFMFSANCQTFSRAPSFLSITKHEAALLRCATFTSFAILS